MYSYKHLFAIALIISCFSTCAMDDQNEQAARPIVDHIKSLTIHRDKTPVIVAIAGCAAVGKTHCADMLKKLLESDNINAKILRGDDFLNPDYIDPDPKHFHPRLEHLLMHDALQKIKDGALSVRKPVWQPSELWPPKKIVEDFVVKDVDVLLFEGEFTLCEEEPYNFKKYSSLTILVDAHDNDIIQWYLNRGRDIGKEETKDDVRERMQKDLARYRSYVQGAQSKASYRIMKNEDHRYALISNLKE